MSHSVIHRPGFAQLALFALAAGLLCGCKQKTEKPAVSADVKNSKADKADKSPTPLQVKDNGPFANLHMPFQEATYSEAPDGCRLITDKTVTVTGKNIAKMYLQIAGSDGKPGLWEQIRFVTTEGKRIRYQAIIKTDLGSMTVDFYPDDAPNHVRSFIALARVGYFDGLPFHFCHSENKPEPFTYLETGCPLGTGDPGYGSIGYWLKPELSDKLTHEEGTLSAAHGEALESAACKFYIVLTKAPWMDGSYTTFAKISQGLNVARKMSQRPVEKDGGRVLDPVLMREVTIQATVEDVAVVAKQ